MRRSVVVVVGAVTLMLSCLVGPPAGAVPRGTPDLPLVGPALTLRQRYAQRQTQAVEPYARRPWSGRHGLTSPVVRPEAVALDRRTGTAYVASQSGSVAVVDTRTCNAVARRCHAPVATLPAQTDPAGVAVDRARRSLYVADFTAGVVQVYDLRRCSARVVDGCRQSPAVLPVGDAPIGLAVDEDTHTLYVGHGTTGVGVVDTAACNGASPAGCGAVLASIPTRNGPALPTVDSARHTLYVPENGDADQENGTTMAVVDLSHCRAGSTSGCGATPYSATVGLGPVSATVDPASDTVYVSSQVDLTVSVLPRSTCTADDGSGCPTSTPPSVKPGLDPQLMAVDRVTRTLYVQVQDSNVVAAVDTRRCNAHAPAGCAQRPRRVSVGAQPFWLDFDQRSRTVYTPDHADDVLEATDARGCSAVSLRTCRREAPIVPGTNGGWSVDTAHHTYVQVDSDGSVLLTDTNRCTARHSGRCGAASVRVPIGATPLGSTDIDPGTHTAYIGTQDNTGVLVVDTSTCNVIRHDGCAPRATIALPDVGFPTVDPRTHTLYVGQFNDGKLAVVRGATCNATDVSGCGDAPLFVPVGDRPYVTKVDDTTGTVYVGNAFGAGDTVTLLPAGACAAATAACQVVATTQAGGDPIGLALDERRHTLFTSTFADEGHGTVALIDTRACNAGHPSGCGTTWHQVAGPRTPFGATVVPADHLLFTENIFDASVSVIDTRRCNAGDHSGCPDRPRRIAVGDLPVAAYPDGPSRTLYVATPAYATTTLIDLDHPCRKRLCVR